MSHYWNIMSTVLERYTKEEPQKAVKIKKIDEQTRKKT